MISRNSINGAFPIKRLGEVVEFLDSKRRPVTESDRRAGPYPYYGANGIQGAVDEFIFDEPLVLLAEDGGHFGEPDRGIAYRISGKTWVNNHAHVLRPTSHIELAYLCRVLENYDVTPFVTGTTRGKLTKAGASEIIIPLPPLAEQRRIAEVLDRAEALRAKRRAAVAQLDSLTQSLFLDLLRQAGKDVATVSIEDGMEAIIDYRGKSPTKTESGVPLVTARVVKGGELLEPNEFIAEEDYDDWMRRGFPKAGDVLFTTEAPLGEVAQLNGRKVALAQRLLVLRGKPSLLDNTFLMHAMTAQVVRDQINARATGSTVRGIRQRELRKVMLPVPPIPLQREFARRVTAVEALKTAQRASLAELDALFATLQHRAFRGEL